MGRVESYSDLDEGLWGGGYYGVLVASVLKGSCGYSADASGVADSTYSYIYASKLELCDELNGGSAGWVDGAL